MVKPKKHLGQHFLTDPSTAERIVNSLVVIEKTNVLEIGPGKGVLTKHLLENKNVEVKVVELDSESVQYLTIHYPNLTVLEGDFLKMNLKEVFDHNSFSLIGNFPYNISSQIVFSILDNRNLIKEMVGMFQKEVAKRICSEPGSKEYGILSVLTQATYECSYLFTVNEGVFFPPPKVKSGVIRLVRKENGLNDDEYKKLKQVVKLAFNQRRKQLRNSLKSMLPLGFENEILSKRPEQLSHDTFLELSRSLS